MQYSKELEDFPFVRLDIKRLAGKRNHYRLRVWKDQSPLLLRKRQCDRLRDKAEEGRVLSYKAQFKIACSEKLSDELEGPLAELL